MGDGATMPAGFFLARAPVMDFYCPECGERFEGPREWLGAKTSCPECGTSFVIELPTPVVRRSDPRSTYRGCGIGLGTIVGGIGGLVGGCEVARRETAGMGGMLGGMKAGFTKLGYGCGGLLVGALVLALLGGLLGWCIGSEVRREE